VGSDRDYHRFLKTDWLTTSLSLPNTKFCIHKTLTVTMESVSEGNRKCDTPTFDMKVLQVRPSSAQDIELKRLDELDRKTQRQCACFAF
jgi:hypothetical protein